MTSFIVNDHVGRPLHPSWEAPSLRAEHTETDSNNHNDWCTFCRIVAGELSCWQVYEDELVIAFLNMFPLRQGHTLVVPKAHYKHVSDLPPEHAAALGVAVSKVAQALVKAFDNPGLNVVCNQEYAQAVPHVHYHVIPAPRFDGQQPQAIAPGVLYSKRPASPLRKEVMERLEINRRSELEDEDAEGLATAIRARL
ncbi:HIT-like protein [Fistulina hepatica ATCC 64428]|uniref:HIT-like protein n=1 Tax=Fistulina hepatica ATCC 64428 TaxID=1128425 RepID=A0A0D7ANC1_9AGAR|nr:HIT-like protein [Fistulina hepatica ATCC 64428]